MNQRHDSAELIQSGRAILGIELGSTRIKASLIGPDTTPLASGAHAWENQLKDGVWTYDMEDVWKGLAACFAALVDGRWVVATGAPPLVGPRAQGISRPAARPSKATSRGRPSRSLNL